jgi:hypothetical protein
VPETIKALKDHIAKLEAAASSEPAGGVACGRGMVVRDRDRSDGFGIRRVGVVAAWSAAAPRQKRASLGSPTQSRPLSAMCLLVGEWIPVVRYACHLCRDSRRRPASIGQEQSEDKLSSARRRGSVRRSRITVAGSRQGCLPSILFGKPGPGGLHVGGKSSRIAGEGTRLARTFQPRLVAKISRLWAWNPGLEALHVTSAVNLH